MEDSVVVTPTHGQYRHLLGDDRATLGLFQCDLAAPARSATVTASESTIGMK